MTQAERIAVIGLGYVGLPVARALVRKAADTIGFDVDRDRISQLRDGIDRTGASAPGEVAASGLRLTDDPAELAGATAFIVTVPTPIDDRRQPDLQPLISASRMVGKALQKGGLVVYESTVYPGLTEEVCVPILAEASGLSWPTDFSVGYSPERINPGDGAHGLAQIVKVVAGDSPETLDRVAAIYAPIIDAGLYRAPSIQVAEAAKVIENTQRDLNIALMNELARIFDRLGLRTADVLAAARTKWNFLPFTPGLVGGHCIGVDPYYLTAKAEAVGFHPEVILAGRRMNDTTAAFIAQQTIKLLGANGVGAPQAVIGVFGATFKDDVPDLRNTQVSTLVEELRSFGATVRIFDPIVDPSDATKAGLALSPRADLTDLDGLVLAVPHQQFRDEGIGLVAKSLKPGGVVIDVKSVFKPADLAPQFTYWSL